MYACGIYKCVLSCIDNPIQESTQWARHAQLTNSVRICNPIY